METQRVKVCGDNQQTVSDVTEYFCHLHWTFSPRKNVAKITGEKTIHDKYHRDSAVIDPLQESSNNTSQYLS